VNQLHLDWRQPLKEKNNLVQIILSFAICVLIFSACEEDPVTPDVNPPPHFPVFTGPYLGQQPPGQVPVRFAPPILLANDDWFWVSAPVFTLSGLEMIFTKMINEGNDQRKELSRMVQNADRWAEPHIPSFANTSYSECNPLFTRDGSTLYYYSQRPGGSIYRVRRTEGGWGQPEHIMIPLPDGLTLGWNFSRTANQTFYFDLSNVNDDDIYCTRLVNGQYEVPVELGESINSDSLDYAPFVDPDEEYMIFVSRRPEGFGHSDLYISFRREDGTWRPAVNMKSLCPMSLWMRDIFFLSAAGVMTRVTILTGWMLRF
jgi:hypothetical protein